MYGGYGSGFSFSIQDYAPRDPLNEVSGFTAPTNQQQPHQSTSSSSIPSSSRNSAIVNNRTDFNAPRPEIGRGPRNVSSEQMQRDFQQAAPYIPTPINGNTRPVGNPPPPGFMIVQRQQPPMQPSAPLHRNAASRSALSAFDEMSRRNQDSGIYQHQQLRMPQGEGPCVQRQNNQRPGQLNNGQRSQEIRLPYISHVQPQMGQTPTNSGLVSIPTSRNPPTAIGSNPNPGVVKFLPPNDPRAKTHVCFNNCMYAAADILNLYMGNSLHLSTELITKLRTMVPPRNSLYLSPEQARQQPPNNRQFISQSVQVPIYPAPQVSYAPHGTHQPMTREQFQMMLMQQHHQLNYQNQLQQQMRQQQPHNQTAPPAVPSRQGQNPLDRLVPEESNAVIRPSISADEAPPPCPYTPQPPGTNSSQKSDEPVDVKPSVRYNVKPTKKKKPELITLDDDEPRTVRVKQEPPEESNTMPSGSVATATPSTSNNQPYSSSVPKTSHEKTDPSSTSSVSAILSSNSTKTAATIRVKQEPSEESNTLPSGSVATATPSTSNNQPYSSSVPKTSHEKTAHSSTSSVSAIRSSNSTTTAATVRVKQEPAENPDKMPATPIVEPAETPVSKPPVVKKVVIKTEPDEVIVIGDEPDPIPNQDMTREIEQLKFRLKEQQKLIDQLTAGKLRESITPAVEERRTSSDTPCTSSFSSSSNDTESFVISKPNNEIDKLSENTEDDDDMPERSKERPASIIQRPPEKRRIVVDDSNEDDDDMPIIRRKKNIVILSDDDSDFSKPASPSSSSEFEENSGDEKDSIENFIVNDDDTIEFEEEGEKKKKKEKDNHSVRASRSEKRAPVRPRSERKMLDQQTPTRSAKSKSESREFIKPSESKEMTAYDLVKERRKRNIRTREENREKKRLAQLQEMEKEVFTIGNRRTRTTGESASSPLSDSLQQTIAIFNKSVSKGTKEPQRKADNPEIRKKNQSSAANKRPPSSAANEDDDSDGVHVPAKRMAHTTSVPLPSKSRPEPSCASLSRSRLSQNDMLEKRYKESEEKKKKYQDEYETLKKLKYPTEEQRIRLNKLRHILNSKKNDAEQSLARQKSGQPVVNLKPQNMSKIVIKQEPNTSPFRHKTPPTPDLLEPGKRSFLQARKKGIDMIFKQLLDSDTTNATKQAKEIELEIATKNRTEDKYRVAVSHKVATMRRASTSGIMEVNSNAVSHNQILAGGPKENCTVVRKRKCLINHRDMSVEQIRPFLVQFKLTDAELLKNSYPLFHGNLKVAEIAENTYNTNKKVFLEDYDMTRTCSRCNKEFRLKPDGKMVREKDICRYHNRGTIRSGKRDTYGKRYVCCNEEHNSTPGCKFSDVHVFDQLFKKELNTFIETPNSSSTHDPRSIKAFALDCEMVYTVAGPALARLTMVDMQYNKVLDIFIKPPTEVLDPNTEFSGLTMEQIENAKDTMQTCHQKLFNLINSETILIGHSLESDLKAMRVVHRSVIDTAVLFRDANDLKIALKTLSSRYLGKQIQGDNEDAVGHDSLEDARACVDLIYYGLKNMDRVRFSVPNVS